MLTIKKRGLTGNVLSVILLSVAFLTACGPAGPRALQKGQRLVAAGKLPEAIAKLEQATQLLTNAPAAPIAEQAQAWNWLGVARHKAGLFVPASQAYQTALRLDRNCAPADYNLGCLLWELKYYRECVDPLLSSLTLAHPAEITEREVYFKVGSAYLHQGMQATSAAERIRNLDAAGRFLVESQKKGASAEALNGLGMFYLLRHRSPNEAVVRFKEALRLQPGYPPSMLNLAIVHHYYLNDRRLALQEYKSYLALQPAPADSKEVENVARDLERDLNAPATPSSPATNKAGTNAAPASARSVEKADAEKSSDSAKPAVAAKDSTSSTNTDGVATSDTAKSSNTPTNAAVFSADRPKIPATPSPARWHYSANFKPAPGNREEAARCIAQGLQAQRGTNWAEAVNAYRNAIKADPSSFEANYRLGAACQETGNVTGALEAFERAVSLSPESVDARYAFGLALYKGKYPQDAAKELEDLLKQAPGEARAHLLVANIYARDLNQPTQAREHYTKVLEIEPRNAQAAAIRTWLATGAM